MGTTMNHDPFGFIEQLCYVSSSDELYLSRCRFVGEEESDEEIDENTPHDEVSVSIDHAVDLGIHRDLGFGEEKSQQQVENFRGFKGDSSGLVNSVDVLKFEEAGLLFNSPNSFESSISVKRSENCELSSVKTGKPDSSTEVLEFDSRVEEEKHEEIVNLVTGENEENKKCAHITLSGRNIDDDVIVSDEENENCLETCEVVRIPTAGNTDYDDEDDDDDNELHVGSSIKNLNNQNESERKPLVTRVLPHSINGQVEAGRDKLKVDRDSDTSGLNMLDVLKILADREKERDYRKGLSILDVAKSCDLRKVIRPPSKGETSPARISRRRR